MPDLPEFLSGLPEVVPPEVELSILLGLPEFVSEEGVVVSGEKWSNSATSPEPKANASVL